MALLARAYLLALLPLAPWGAAWAQDVPTEGGEPEALELEVVSEPATLPDRYRSLAEVEAKLVAWAAAEPVKVQLIELPRSAGGQRVPAVQLASPGAEVAESRPTVFFVGGLDGVSLAGAEACLWIGEHLLADPYALPSDLSVILVPWGSPDALARVLETSAGNGGEPNARPMDDDGDGAIDEDPPDDVDSDGEILHMLIEDSTGAWKRASDPRFLERAEPGDSPRYRLVREGRDDDGDGRFNEDGVGGVVLDRSFPIGWRGDESSAGPWPLSEPLARGLADLVLQRRTMSVVLLQGAHGKVVVPGGSTTSRLAPRDRAAFERMAGLVRAATGRAVSKGTPLGDERGVDSPGAALDWLYAVPSCLAVEVAPWGLEYPGPQTSAPDPYDPRWAGWLDEKRDGIGFVEWSPVQLGGQVSAMVGGWRPRMFANPPTDALGASIDGLAAFAHSVLVDAPRLEVEFLSKEREGEVCELVARIRNRGGLPSGMDPNTVGRVELELPADARVIAGSLQPTFRHLAGGTTTAEMRWILTLPKGGVVILRARDDWTATGVGEVRP